MSGLSRWRTERRYAHQRHRRVPYARRQSARGSTISSSPSFNCSGVGSTHLGRKAIHGIVPDGIEATLLNNKSLGLLTTDLDAPLGHHAGKNDVESTGVHVAALFRMLEGNVGRRIGTGKTLDLFPQFLCQCSIFAAVGKGAYVIRVGSWQ